MLAKRREVGPPPGLAAAGRRLSPGPQGLLAGLLGLPVWAGTSRPTSPWPEKERFGSDRSTFRLLEQSGSHKTPTHEQLSLVP